MKPVKAIVKLQILAGQANPAPPVGTSLGPHGINIQQFCQQFNEATKDMGGEMIPAEITVYEDQSFDFRLKTPPASYLLKKAARPIGDEARSSGAARPIGDEARSSGAAGIEKGAANATAKAGKITRADLRKIAERKMVDLNAGSIEAAEKIIAGTARNMGIEIIE